MPLYTETFPVGSRVTIVDRGQLDEFRASWILHNPLTEEQLTFAAQRDRVRAVGFYHGGDVLYELENAPGVWHECCLTTSAAGTV